MHCYVVTPTLLGLSESRIDQVGSIETAENCVNIQHM